MEYTVSQLAALAGVSARTIRHYDAVGLLKPAKIAENGYRLYNNDQVDMLQQILFYKELGIPLGEINLILSAPEFDPLKALYNHLAALERQKEHTTALIETVQKTIDHMLGGNNMNDKEKFEGFKKELIDQNEKAYGDEVRAKYGDDAVNASNAKFAGISQEKWHEQEVLNEQIAQALKAGTAVGDPGCSDAQHACELHARWLMMFWPDGMYSKEAHLGLGEMYVADERFQAYYNNIAIGAAVFLRDALQIYCK